MAKQYRLRASAPMPIPGSTASSTTSATGAGGFILQTFGAESNVIDIESCATVLPASSEFRGQNPNGPLISASYSRIGDRTGKYFQGRKVHVPVYVDEGVYSLF
jgi:hypothetical protein